MNKTKIICTIGPSCYKVDKIVSLINNGLDCARLNFSHGDYKTMQEYINNINKASNLTSTHIPILLDTKGPEIRLNKFIDGTINLKSKDIFILDTNIDKDGDNSRISITYPYLYKYVSINNKILIDDGNIILKVIKIDNSSIITKVIQGGILSNNKSINIPNVSIKMNYLSSKDKEDLLFGIKNNIDFVASSFTRTKEDIIELRGFLDNNGGKDIEIIAKIENKQGVKNFDSILDYADGIMVARGDLGVEIDFKDIPTIQKRIIDRCNKRGKLSVVATQMLESMTTHSRPTRAEVSDVANAVFDGTSCVMLSGETASGKYPIEAVKTMDNIISSAEKSIYHKPKPIDYDVVKDITLTTTKGAYEAAEYINAKMIFVLSTSGRTPKDISIFKPTVPVIALVVEEKGCKQCNLYYDIFPNIVPKVSSQEEAVELANRIAITKYNIKKGDIIVVVTGTGFSKGNTDSLFIYEAK